jgi:uncharacterized membrane protein YdbT with pleckstrin-like domain
MSYVSRSLGPGETLVHVASISWVSYFWSFVVAALGVFALFSWPRVGLALIALGVVAFGAIHFRNSTIELAVTNHKVVAKRGFLARRTLEQRLDKINAIDVDQSVMGRIFNYGDVTIHGTGVDATSIRGISDPLTFRRKVEQAIEARSVGAPPLTKDLG